MKTSLTRLVGALIALVLITAACGDDDDATTAVGQETDGEVAQGDDGSAGDCAADGADCMQVMDDDATSDDSMADDEMAMDDGQGDEGHSHGDGLEVPEGMAVPQIDIAVTADPMAGQNLQVQLVDFTVTPENASLDPVDGEGHLHLYVNGERMMRFYNEWLHLSLPAGDHVVEVEVSANDHSAYTVDGEPIRAMAMVSVSDSDGGHSHGDTELVDIDAADAPSVSIEIFEDPISGWNVHAVASDYTIAPENASTDHVEGEGHMHLYVDGQKITRLYGEWWHLSSLTEGDHEVMVELSANDHRAYALDGEPIVAAATVTVSADQASDGGHSDDDHGNDDDGEHGGDADDDADDDVDEGDGEEATGDADVVIPVTFEGGEVVVSDDRIEIARGQVVLFTVTSDVAEHVHIHGYDLFADVAAGETASVMFTADVPGVFEVEFEDSFTFITEIEVR